MKTKILVLNKLLMIAVQMSPKFESSIVDGKNKITLNLALVNRAYILLIGI